MKDILPLVALGVGAWLFMNRANAAAPAAAAATGTAAAAAPKKISVPKTDATGNDKYGRPFVFVHPDRGGTAGKEAARKFDAVVAAGGPLPSGAALTAKRTFIKPDKTTTQITLNEAFWLNHVDAHTPDQRIVGDDSVRADYAEYLRRAYAAAA